MKQLALVSTFKSTEGSRGGLVIEGWANKAVVDRGGDLINKEAWNLDNFHKNAMILYNHDRDKPIGKALKVEPRDEGLYIKARISGSSDPEIAKIRDLIKEGILNTFSVGFDCKREEKSASGHNEIKEAELFEVSVVTLPMNQDSTFNVSKTLDDVRKAAMDYATKMDEEKEPVAPEDENAEIEIEVEPAEVEPAEEDKEPEMDDATKEILDAFKADVEATMTGEGNPAAWVADEELWAKAKEVSQAALGELNYGFITWYYLTHGGSKKQKSVPMETTPPVIDQNPYLEQSRQTNILLGTLISEVQKLGVQMQGSAAKPAETVAEPEMPKEESASQADDKVAKLLKRAKALMSDTNTILKNVGV
jgi:HK97 family phage prohead protease